MTLLDPYRPPHAPGWVGYVLGWIAAIAAFGRGIDYLTGPETHGGTVLSVVEAFGSNRQWGAWLTGGSVVLAVALIAGRVGPLILAHLGGVTVFVWYGIALGQGVVAADDGGRFLVPIAANIALNVTCLVLLGREVRRAVGPPPVGD